MITRRNFLKLGGIAASSLFLPRPSIVEAAYPKRVFYISDQGVDPDDILDAWKLGIHARRHDIQIVGAASCINSGYAAPVLKIVFNYFNIPDMRYGKYTGSAVFPSAQGDCWGHGLATAFGGDTEADASYANSATLLNDVLADSPDNSVHIISTGMLSVEAEALAVSGAPALWAAKVAAHYPVAGEFLQTGDGNTVSKTPLGGWNLYQAPTAAYYFLGHVPVSTPVIWCGLELVPGSTVETIWAGPPDTPSDAVSPLKWVWHNACFNHIGQGADPLPDNDGSGNGGMRWMWSAPAIEELVHPGRYTSRSVTGHVTYTEDQDVTFTPGPRPVTGANAHQYLSSLLTFTQWKALLAQDMAEAGPFGAMPQALIHSGSGFFQLPAGVTLKIQ